MVKTLNTSSSYHNCDVDGNTFGSEGCNYLSQSQWKKLNTLHIGTSITTKKKIILVMQDVNIYRGLIGTIYKH
jgi:heat shock protein HslJ